VSNIRKDVGEGGEGRDERRLPVITNQEMLKRERLCSKMPQYILHLSRINYHENCINNELILSPEIQ